MLLGHLVGDFIAQDDWQAANKANPSPVGDRPNTDWNDGIGGGGRTPGTAEDAARWDAARRKWWVGHLACTVHCVLYALCCWVFCFAWMPWWGAVVVGLVHWPIDRFRLPRLFMERVHNQRVCARGPLAPWSVIVVDQVWHLLTLYLVWFVCR